MHHRFAVSTSLIALTLTMAPDGRAGAQTTAAQELTDLSIEQLMNVEVTSVSKKDQKLLSVGTAIYVMTAEDIRRSGASTLPDLLRSVPGMHVAQMDANTWAISIRGFTDRYGDKVLVLIDGRVVYTPTSSGVNWDQQDVVFEDIDRIEVIRGPGGTVWGANAVNGVINVITKSTEATQGALVGGGAGSRNDGQGLIQYGGHAGQAGTYRVFGNYSQVGISPSPSSDLLNDGWHKLHGGFRADWTASAQDRLTVQGDFLQARERQTIDTIFSNDGFRQATIDDVIRVDAGNILARWTRTVAGRSESSLQFYYDHDHRLDAGLDDNRHTLDLEGQRHAMIGARHDLVFGFDYRFTTDTTIAGYSKSYLPSGRSDNLSSVFLQDEIKLSHALSLTGGAKLEHNAYTGLEYEPSAQLVWTPSPGQALWTSASRGVRQPALADVAIQHDVAAHLLDSGALAVTKIVGDPTRQAERLHDFGAGYRAQVRPTLSVDVTAFSSSYFGLQTAEPGDPYLAASPAPLHWVYPTLSSDHAHAHNYGVEVFANWEPIRRWRLRPGYSFIHMNVEADASSQDSEGASAVSTQTPTEQFQLHSFLTFAHNIELDSAVYYVDNLPDSGDGPTPSYTRLDTRLGWRINRQIEISVVGQNLLSGTHAEFHDDLMLHTLVVRSLFTKITCHF